MTLAVLQCPVCRFVITGTNAGITITHGAILRFFAPQGRHVPPIVAKFGTAEENNNSLRNAKFQMDRSIIHIWGFLTQKLQNPEFCKLIRPVRANPSIDIHDIHTT